MALRFARHCTTLGCVASRLESETMASNALQASWPSQAIATEGGPADSMPEILYVMGTGRSGTTILEVLLTNEEGITSTGEVKHIFRDAFVRDLQCACG